jgi:hypothetical protein
VFLNPPQTRRGKNPVKIIKEKRGSVKMVVDEDIPVSEVLRYTCRTLVGRFLGKHAGEKATHCWMELQWKPLLGYVLEVHVLMRGWITFIVGS